MEDATGDGGCVGVEMVIKGINVRLLSRFVPRRRLEIGCRMPFSWEGGMTVPMRVEGEIWGVAGGRIVFF